MSHKFSEDLLAKIEAGSARIAILGLGYVGLPLAVATAKGGLHVTGFDIDPEKINRLYAGKSYIGAVSDADLVRLRDTQCVAWTDDFRLGN